MKNDLLKSKKVLAGVLSVLAVGTIGAIILTQEPETSDMKEIKTEQSGELKTSTAVKNGSDLIFDENSEKTSDGTPIIQGDYSIDDVLQMADLNSFSYPADAYQPTREEALLQARLSKPVTGIETPDVMAQAGDTIVVNLVATENGKNLQELSTRASKFILGSRQGDEKLEEALIGTKLFTKTTKEISYPDDYSNKDLAGRTISYEFEMVQLARPEEPSEEEVTQIYNALLANAEYSNKYKKIAAAKIYLRDNSTVKSFPAKLIVKLQKEYQDFFFGEKYKSEEEFFEKTKADKNEYYAGRSEYVRAKMKDELLLEKLSAQSGINTESSEYTSAVSNLFTADQKRDLLFELTLGKLLQ